MKTVAEIEYEYDEKVVAIVYTTDGAIHDYTFNWQSAQNYALSEGYKVVAIADDGSMTKAEIQALCDAEKARHDDCFGITVIETDDDEVEAGRRERRDFYRNRDY